MNKDQVEGRRKEIAGKLKQVTGKVIGNRKIEAKGTVEKIVGKAQVHLGDVKAGVKKAVS